MTFLGDLVQQKSWSAQGPVIDTMGLSIKLDHNSGNNVLFLSYHMQACQKLC